MARPAPGTKLMAPARMRSGTRLRRRICAARGTAVPVAGGEHAGARRDRSAPWLAGRASGKYDPRARRSRRLQGMASVSSRQNRRGAVVFAGDATAIDPADSHPARREMLLVFKAFLAIQWGDPADVKLFARQALDELGDSASFFRAYALSFLGQAQNSFR